MVFSNLVDFFRFRINKDDLKKVFRVDLGITFGAANIDRKLLQDFEIPIPICNGNFSLQGIYIKATFQFT